MIPILKPYMPKEILPELENILYSGNLSYGKYGKIFENKLIEYINNQNILTVASYNQAMLLAISVLNLKAGDEVIASPVSCLASNQPFVNKGLKVVWADVDPNTGTLSIDDVRAKITSKTKAIFHNHFCGYLGDIKALNQLAKEYGLWVVDDCIESFGSEYEGKKTGNLGTDVTIFSFQTVRLPNTIDGAALCFFSKELYDKAILMRDYGIDRSEFRLNNGEINPNCDIHLEGYGATMNEVNSYIGVMQMGELKSLLSKQQNNAQHWDREILKNVSIKSLNIEPNSKPNYWVYGVTCSNKLEALNFFRDKDWYATSVHINNNVYSVFKNSIELKGVNEFMNKFLALPCGWWVDFDK